MKLIFNDATELNVQIVTCEGDYLNIKTVSATPEQLRQIFEDTLKTKKIIVEERGKQAVYEGYTTFYRTEEYAGKIYGVVMYRPEKTPEAQKEVQEAALMVAQIQAQELPDEQALTVQAIYPVWDGNSVPYTVGYKVLSGEILYKCLQTHVSQADWSPETSPSLWAKVLNPDPENIPEWEQPESTNGYATGDKVTHNEKTWVSLVDNNIWEPGATGTESIWKEAEE